MFQLKKILIAAATVVLLFVAGAVAQEKPFTADRHKAVGLTCDACHGEAKPSKPASPDVCLGCHESLEAVAKRTQNRTPNPHKNHITEASDPECTQCHHGHKADRPLCFDCHSGLKFEKQPAPAK